MKSIILVSKLALVSLIFILIALKFCCPKDDNHHVYSNTLGNKILLDKAFPLKVAISNNIMVENYFQFIDAFINKYDSITPYSLTEHLLVRSNSWALDALQNTDYYRMIAFEITKEQWFEQLPLPISNSFNLNITLKKITKELE